MSKEEKQNNQLYNLIYLQNKLSVTEKLSSFYTEILSFIVQYSFIFNESPAETESLTPDPARDGGNWYGYAGQNPLIHIDPTGLAYYTGPTGSSVQSSNTPVTPHEFSETRGPSGGPAGTPKIPDTSTLADNISTSFSSKLNINNSYQLKKGTINRPGIKIKKIKGVVIHWTGKKQSAKTTIKYWNYSKTYNSAQYVIDTEGEIFSAIPDDEVAWHSGESKDGKYKYTDKSLSIIDKTIENDTVNNYLIGIELEPITDETGTGEFSLATTESAVKLTAALLIDNKLNPDTSLYRHYDLTTKPCPLFYINDSNWEVFVNSVKNEMEKMGGIGYEY